MNSSEYKKLLLSTLSDLDLSSVDRMKEYFLDAYSRQATIFIFGNGGSGASASHAAGDFIKGASFGLEKRFRVICLNDNVPSMMAYANDVGWDSIFIEPLKNYLRDGDLVIGLSGSGNSVNVLNAINYAKSKGAITIGMTGFKGGQLSKIVDLNIHSSAMDMEIAEDIHMIVFNMVKKGCMRNLMESNINMGDIYEKRINV